MKTKVLITLLFSFLILNNSNGQNLEFSNEFLLSSHYANLAELAICENDLPKAMIYYDSLFSLKTQPNSRDLFNSALCAQKLRNYSLLNSRLKLLIHKGYSEERLKSCFDTLIINKFKKVDGPKEQKIKETIADIIESDQHTNSLKYSNMENFVNTVLSNAERIMKLTREAEMDSTISFTIGNSSLHVQILHFFQLWGQSNKVKSDSLFLNRVPRLACLKNVDFEKYEFDEFLIDQTIKGNYDRYGLASYISNLNHINLKNNAVTQFDEYIMVDKPELLSKDELELINANRKMFGLESYEDYFIKVHYADSLLTNGHPFTSIPFNKNNNTYRKLIIENEEKCKFEIVSVSSYRLMMGFTNPEDAKKKYEDWLEKNNK